MKASMFIAYGGGPPDNRTRLGYLTIFNRKRSVESNIRHALRDSLILKAFRPDYGEDAEFVGLDIIDNGRVIAYYRFPREDCGESTGVIAYCVEKGQPLFVGWVFPRPLT